MNAAVVSRFYTTIVRAAHHSGRSRLQIYRASSLSSRSDPAARRAGPFRSMVTETMRSVPSTSPGPSLQPTSASSQSQAQPAIEPQELATAEAIQSMLASVDDIIFDCDGVLWHGDNLLPGVQDTLAALQRAGKRLFYVTNNASKSRRQYSEKIRRLGIENNPRHVYGSAYAAASYLKRLGFEKKVFVVGMEGIENELDEAEIAHIAGSGYVAPGWTVDDAAGIELDPEVGAVVVGFDSRANYCKLAAAAQYIRYNPGCLFIATNADASANASNGRIIPGAGTLVRAIQLATGREPLVMGKPEPFLLDAIAEEHGIAKNRTLMVGDRLDTDIEFGFNYGIRTLLVYTGVTTPELLHEHRTKKQIVPDLCLSRCFQFALRLSNWSWRKSRQVAEVGCR
ncbi:2-phosphoglycolate phosphatase [Klebsormidium nitens]|uniref:phosphoglycolate phosphatase n=1 Tax=Klebsormidium nitens TaxID=105231 RepID=A0A1Y1HSH8_KLENI|nr:2-phosphoglycolate phosphatase [Klebsormidium nitens]|eukprot:GAQ80772.1 2-phosphoglycolate phosphatase [Klebsormidium nitens]